MATDYEKYYRDTKHALGEPTKEFVQFFATYAKPNVRVLDVGCGQGRDALFIARLGHNVLGIDTSSSGIRDMVADSELEGLGIVGEVADIRSYEPQGEFDIILIDRTLHMLNKTDRLNVLGRLVDHVTQKGHLLVADEHVNMPGFNQVLEASGSNWEAIKQRKGFLFAIKNA